MKNKIIKITLAQIIMWAAACLADIICYANQDSFFIQCIFYFTVPIFLLVKYPMLWSSVYVYDKKDRLIKWIVQYGISLVIWWLETYCFVNMIEGLVEADRFIIHKQGFLVTLIYWWWALLAVVIPAIAVTMHILTTVIKCLKKYQAIHYIVNLLLTAAVIVLIILGMIAYVAWIYFAAAILVVFAGFYFNWCYYKVQ